MINLRRTSGELVARDIDVQPPGALRAAVADAFPGATVAVASPSNAFFGWRDRLMKAPYTRYARNDFWVDRDGATVVSTRSRGASSAEVLAAARPLDADYAPIEVNAAWADPHPPMAVEPVVSVLADYDPADFVPIPASTWGVPRQVKPPVAIDDRDYAPLPPSVWS